MDHGLFPKPNFCSSSHCLSKFLCLCSPSGSMLNLCSVHCVRSLILLLQSDLSCFVLQRVLAVVYITGPDSCYIVCSSSSGAKFFQFNTQQMCSQSLQSCFKNSYSQSIFIAGWLTNRSFFKGECFHN